MIIITFIIFAKLLEEKYIEELRKLMDIKQVELLKRMKTCIMKE